MIDPARVGMAMSRMESGVRDRRVAGLAGKRALVTGHRGGIGRAIAETLEVSGARVLGLDLPEVDVADADSVRALFGVLPGGLEVLVTAAGIAGADPPEGDPALEAHWRAVLGTNLDGTWRCCAAAAPLLPDGRGRIVTIASVLGLRGAPDQAAYSAAKHGVIGLTRALAQRLAPRRITVNALARAGWRRRLRRRAGGSWS